MLRPVRACCCLLLLLLATAVHAEDRPAILLKVRSDGAHAARECLEKLHRSGARIAPTTADGSDSLDRLKERAGVTDVRALFRRPDGRSFAAQRRRLRAKLRRLARTTADLPDLAHVYRVELSGETSLDEVLAGYRADPHVVWAQRDHTHDLDDLPNDPFLSSSGSWGQEFEDLWGVYRIRAPEAWEITRGAGVIVAVVDTGLDYDHPDIAENVWLNAGEDLDGNGWVDASDFNGIDDDGNGFIDDLRGFDFASSVDADGDGDYDGPEDVIDPDPFDLRGHGTHVAGTVGAVADNGIGIAGIAPEATIMPLAGFPLEGPGRDSDLWRAVLYAAENGAQVINNSWSCNPLCPVNPLAEEIVRLVHAMDVIVVTSAGNAQTDVVFNSPENLRETITVASSGHDDLPSASFTNSGWLVDVAAPGGGPSDDLSVRIARRNILSLRSSAFEFDEFAWVGDAYLRFAGTSMSAPHVAGVAALIRSAMPDLDYESVRRRIRTGAEDTGPPGHDRIMGAGRLDAFRSLTLELPSLTAAITGPRQGSTFLPEDGPEVAILGTAAGDDFAEYQIFYGLGRSPDSFTPIGPPRTSPVTNGVLGDWTIEGLEEGSYVVRLDVAATDGTRYSEFLIASLERRAFERISSDGPPAEMPDVSGRFVVWQSARDDSQPPVATPDPNLFATDLETGREIPVHVGPGIQELPSIAWRNVSWLDDRNDPETREVYGCRIDTWKGTCPDAPVSDGFVSTFPPVSTPGSFFWLDGRSGDTDVRACKPDWQGGVCHPFETGLEPRRRVFLQTDGRSLVWAEPGSRFGICDLHPKLDTCERTTLTDPIFALSRPAFSNDLLAFVGFGLGGRDPLSICEVDRETGSCEASVVATRVGDRLPKLSGRRLVWDGTETDQASDVFFCEYDRVLGTCPVQRVTAHIGFQGNSDVDGDWLVWQDDRTGPAAVWGLRLPGLEKLYDRRTREGKKLVVPVRSTMGRGGPDVEVSVQAVGHPSLEALGARFVREGRGAGRIVWRPAPGQAGSYAFTVTAEEPTGLVTRRTFRVDVGEGFGRKSRQEAGSRTGRPDS